MADPKCPKCDTTDLKVSRYKWGEQMFFGRAYPQITISSLIRCENGHEWRTTAKYIDSLPWIEGANALGQPAPPEMEGS